MRRGRASLRNRGKVLRAITCRGSSRRLRAGGLRLPHVHVDVHLLLRLFGNVDRRGFAWFRLSTSPVLRSITLVSLTTSNSRVDSSAFVVLLSVIPIARSAILASGWSASSARSHRQSGSGRDSGGHDEKIGFTSNMKWKPLR